MQLGHLLPHSADSGLGTFLLLSQLVDELRFLGFKLGIPIGREHEAAVDLSVGLYILESLQNLLAKPIPSVVSSRELLFYVAEPVPRSREPSLLQPKLKSPVLRHAPFARGGSEYGFGCLLIGLAIGGS